MSAKTILACLLTLCLTVGCGATVPPAETVPEELTLYDCGGIQIGVPAKYGEQLLVETTFSPGETPYGSHLLSLSEKASVEAGAADGMEGGIGWLFSIDRLTQAQYEQYLSSDRSERASFARDAESYYVLSSATDVQFYRNDETVDVASPAWKDWETLLGTRETICADMIARNDLTPWTDSAFLSREFTYDSPHAYVKYCPYYTFDGSRGVYDTLVLSQPQKQGEGGIWCVERFYDFSGNVYPLFPQTEDGADAYFARLQADCDSGDGDPALLSPTGAALGYVRATDSFFADAKATADSLVPMDGVNHAYFAQNNRASQLVLDLLLEQPVSGEELLACADGFTPDNWGVLGRYQYGSDWWSPLETALKEAAVGAGQAERDGTMLRFALSYPKDTGEIAAGLTRLLARQKEADSAVFQQVLEGFSPEEQARIARLLSR
ncbi:MAG: hypothetical protein RRY95_02690 [Oscillospiraceae bacterium]